MQWNFSSIKKVISFWNPLFQKNIERWDCKRYVLFVDSSYSENDFLKISAFSHMNVDNEWPFWAGFHKVIYKQQGVIVRLTKSFSNLALIIFRKFSKWNDQFEIGETIFFQQISKIKSNTCKKISPETYLEPCQTSIIVCIGVSPPPPPHLKSTTLKSLPLNLQLVFLWTPPSLSLSP